MASSVDSEKPATAESQSEAPSPEEQKDQIEAAQENLDSASEVYLIGTTWFEEWCKYTGFGDDEITNTERPGKIDSTELQDTDFPRALNSTLTEEVQFKYLTPSSWKLLKTWYGVVDDRSIFRRDQTNVGGKQKIELYPYFIEIREYESDGNVVFAGFKQASATSSIANIFEKQQEEHPGLVVRLRVPFRIANFNDEYDEKNIPADFDKETFAELTKENTVWDVTLNSFNNFNRTGEIFIFEYELEPKTNTFPSSKVFDYQKLNIGSVAIGHDQYGKWYHMHVQGLKVKDNKRLFLCHWLGFKASWNEWIPCDDGDKYAPVGSKDHKSVDLKWYPKQRKKVGTTRMNYSSTNRSTIGSARNAYRTGGTTTSKMGSSSYQSPYYKHQEGTSVAEGIVGLRNLGNTCFMNSVIQCFNQTPYIAEYFLQNQYKNDINRNNVLGHKGKVATEWASLMQSMWSKKYKVVVPLTFKKTIGEFAPQFMGYSQQDSQELLGFLLDGIHEDLNSVQDKPYCTKLEVGNRELSEVAQESWGQHLSRNQSIIVSNMHGLLKSRVECPECTRVSVTFDPYSTLSVPIPSKDTKLQIITFIPHRPPPDFVPVAFGVKVPVRATISQLKECLIKQMGLEGVLAEELFIYAVHRGKINKLQKDTDFVSRMSNPTSDDFFAYQAKCHNVTETETPESGEVNKLVIEMLHRKPGTFDVFFGIPLAICIDTNSPTTKEQLIEYILETILPFVKEEVRQQIIDQWGNFDYSSLFDIKWHQAQRAGRYKFTPLDLEELEDISTCKKITLYWKSTEWYDTGPENWSTRKKHSTCTAQRTSGVTLANCFDCFTDEEILQDDNLWYCNQCKVHRPAKKTMSIWTLPNILVVCLKRFHYTRWNRSKISTQVSYPLEQLNLKKWVENPEVREEDCIYDLYGVSNHSGNLGGGHYTAYVKNRLNSKWYNCNDQTSRELSSTSSICTPQSYLLFFHRRVSGSTTGGEGTVPVVAPKKQ